MGDIKGQTQNRKLGNFDKYWKISNKFGAIGYVLMSFIWIHWIWFIFSSVFREYSKNRWAIPGGRTRTQKVRNFHKYWKQSNESGAIGCISTFSIWVLWIRFIFLIISSGIFENPMGDTRGANVNSKSSKFPQILEKIKPVWCHRMRLNVLYPKPLSFHSSVHWITHNNSSKFRHVLPRGRCSAFH